MLNDTNSLLAAKSDDSEWWAVEPDDNLIGFSSGSTSDTGTMNIQFYPGLVGI